MEPSPVVDFVLVVCDRCPSILIGTVEVVRVYFQRLGWADIQGFDICPECKP